MKRFPGKLTTFITYILKYFTCCRVIYKVIIHIIYYNVWQIHSILLQFLFVCLFWSAENQSKSYSMARWWWYKLSIPILRRQNQMIFMSSSSAWYTEWVPGQPRQYREIWPQKEKELLCGFSLIMCMFECVCLCVYLYLCVFMYVIYTCIYNEATICNLQIKNIIDLCFLLILFKNPIRTNACRSGISCIYKEWSIIKML